MLSRQDLHQYQVEGIQYQKDTPKCGCFWGLGVGKTICTLTTLVDLLATGEIKRVIIIAPLRVANGVWLQEAQSWAHTAGLNMVIATGTAKQRLTALNSDHDVCVINQEVVPWLVRNSGVAWKWDMLVYDEATGIKNPSSQRFKALKNIRPKLNRVILLTGTPVPNGMMDVWSLIYMLDGGERLGKFISHYRTNYFTQNFNGFGYKIREGADELITNKISDITLTLAVDDLLDMPKRVDLVESVELPSKVMTQYKAMEEDFFHELEDGGGIEAVHAATLANKLMQMSSGFIYDEDKVAHPLHSEKIARLKEILEANPSENLLVAYNFQHEKDLLLKEFKEAVLLDAKGTAIPRWNKGEIRMLLAHPKSASMGLNLQKGGSVVIWYGLGWNLSDYLQFNGRVYRQGQENHVRIIHLLSKGTIDEKVYSAILAKATTQQGLLDHLKLFNAEF